MSCPLSSFFTIVGLGVFCGFVLAQVLTRLVLG